MMVFMIELAHIFNRFMIELTYELVRGGEKRRLEVQGLNRNNNVLNDWNDDDYPNAMHERF